MEIINWLSTTGTNEIVKGIFTNNSYVLAPVAIIIGAWMKGKHPQFWQKLMTAMPFVGETKKF